MWSNERPTTPGFYCCHQRGKTRIVHMWCYKNGTELFTNEDGGASIKDTLYDDAQWMAAVIPPNPQDQNESAQPAPSVPEGVSFIDTSQLAGVMSTEIAHSYPPPSGWLRAIDEALVVAHLGVASADDTYEQAKAKLDSLIGFHVDVATDPAVNGGWKLVPVDSTPEAKQMRDDLWDALKRHKKEKFNADRDAFLKEAVRDDDGGWTKHTAFHWSRTINGERLDYWPSRKKFQWRGKVLRGDVMKIVRATPESKP